MSRESLPSLISRLEIAWRDRPDGLLRQTLRYAIVGYVLFVSSWLLGLATVALGSTLLLTDVFQFPSVGSALLISLGIIWLLITYSCLRPGHFVPRGLLLQPTDAPKLFTLLSELHPTLPLPGRVYLTPDLNASIVHPARLGVFGWHQNWLTIGLPLLHILPPEELRAVLAHEIAHISPLEKPTLHWLQRTRHTWTLVAERSEKHAARPLFNWIFLWLSPRVHAPALVLARRHELACDRFASRLTSPQTLASALKRIAISQSKLHDLHQSWLENHLNSSESPPCHYVETVLQALSSPLDDPTALLRLQNALQTPSDPTATHPSLAERLRHLHQAKLPVELPPPHHGPSAASELLPQELLHTLPQRLSHAWQNAQSSHWITQHRQKRASLARSHSREIVQSWKRIASLSRLDGLASIQPEILRFLTRQPCHSGALFLRGCYLADQGDPSAVPFLENSAKDPTITRQALETLLRFHLSQNRDDLASPLRKQIERHEIELRAALIERNHITPSDSFLPNELSPKELDLLRSILAEYPAIQRAWLVRKHVRHFPHWNCYLLGIQIHWPSFYHSSLSSTERLCAQILDEWHIDGFVLPLIDDEAHRLTLRALRRTIPDAEIFRFQSHKL